MYGCFGIGFTTLVIFTSIFWYIDKNVREESGAGGISRGIKISVYLITAFLAVSSSVMSLIEVDQEKPNYRIVPVCAIYY